MKDKIMLLMVFIVGLVIGQFLVGNLQAYGEKDGSWSSSEKQQVIHLLERIEQNTRGGSSRE